MGRINILGFDVANLIAAGEVVDRPSSVVKELLENSIDAGATVITVEIQRGGVAFIRISDNGCGMDADDLPVAILRHATSKIKEADDLSHISSLGFRGEALAAISSVSKIRIFSKPKDSPMGAILTAEGGEVLDITETGCADGTTVVVEDLFYNVPARRKFLKKDTTEAVAVGAVVERIALSRPDISVKYICDGELKFVTAGDSKLYSAVYAVFGKDIAGRTIEVSRAADGISVTGYISEPDLFKSNRNMENFFVNGRYVKSKTAMAAVEQAYKTRIPQDKFPVCVLNIDINPAAVDVNVHPAKLEVKFTNERIIFEAVYYAVLNALESRITRPELTLTRERHTASPQSKNSAGLTSTNAENAPLPSRDKKDSFWIDGAEARRLLGAFVPADAKPPKAEQVKMSFNAPYDLPKEQYSPMDLPQNEEKPPKSADIPRNEPPRPPETASAPPATAPKWQEKMFMDTTSSTVAENTAADKKAFAENPDVKSAETAAEAPGEEAAANEIPDYIILGEAYNCYVIVQLEDRLLFIDKHAAHERIIFDELVRKMKSSRHDGQLLLVPLTLPLLEIEADAISEYADKIRALGYDFTLENDGAQMKATVTAVPDMLTTAEASELFHTLASRLTDVGAGADAAAEEFFSARLFQSACKAAIKGGRVYDMAHIRWICDRLLVTPGEGKSAIRTCPHGRPVAFEVKKSSIDRQFARLT